MLERMCRWDNIGKGKIERIFSFYLYILDRFLNVCVLKRLRFFS